MTQPVKLIEVERPLSTDDVGLTLADGRSLLASAQQYFVRARCLSMAEAHSYCPFCDARLSRKRWHDRQIRTVFWRVTVSSPRVRYCLCDKLHGNSTYSPLNGVLPFRVTPELEYLQVKWAAQLPYASANELLSEMLPIAESISVSGIKRRVRAVGESLDQRAGRDWSSPSGRASTPINQAANDTLASLAVDSAWLKHCDPPRFQRKHVNVVAGRACFDDGRSRLYAYVLNQVPSAARRLDDFLAANDVDTRERITIVTDGAHEFEKAVNGSIHPICRVLNWFHIAMKFRLIEQGSRRYPVLLAPNGRPVHDEIASVKWLVWHGKSRHAVARLKRIYDAIGEDPPDRHSTLHWNLRQTYLYLESHRGFLVNYGRRYYKGLPISSATAESAVNQVVSARTAKKRQMRWSDEGAHLLAQVRVGLLNGELTPRARPVPLRLEKPEGDSEWDANLMAEAA